MGYLKTYLTSSIVDFLLLLVACVSMEHIVMQGFFVAPGLLDGLALRTALSAVLLVVLYGAFSGRRARIPLLVVCACLVVGLVAWGMLSSVGDPLADAEESNLRFALVMALVPVVVFLLSRRRGTFAVLLPATLLVVGFIQYAYRPNLYLESLLVFGCLAALFAYRTFLECVYAADSLGKVRFVASGLTAVAPVAISIACALLLYFAVVAPLAPDYVHVKLFTEERTLETVEVDNPYSVVEVEDESMLSTNTTDEMVLGNKTVEVDGSSFEEDVIKRYTDETLPYSGSSAGEDASGDEPENDFYSYELPEFWWVLLITMGILVLVAAVMIRWAVRFRRTCEIATKPRSDQATLLYTILLRRLDKLGLGKPASMTPLEFAEESRERMSVFDQDDVTVASLSALYTRVHYGGMVPTDEEIGACWRFNNGFMRGVIRQTGRLKYCLKYYWIL